MTRAYNPLFVLLLLSFAWHATALCATDSGLTRWSQWANRPSAENDPVTIPAGTRILLDVPPTFVVDLIDVSGDLVFADSDMDLKVRRLLVRQGGHVWMGTPSCPLTKKVIVTLYGLPQSPFTEPPLLLANKVFGAFSGGQIDIHGKRNVVSYTHLGSHAVVGDTTITLATAPGWAVGDTIVISSTDWVQIESDPQYNVYQSEKRTITRISGTSVTLDAPLDYGHYGRVWSLAGDNEVRIDMRAEVSLLTRNVVIRGDLSEGNTRTAGWGGHMMVEGASQLRLDGVEFYHVGQRGNKARYPIHYHIAGSQRASYVRSCAVHSSFQRGIVIHGTNDLTVSDNVLYDITGHAVFIEDGNEMGNTLTRNLVMKVNRHNLLVADASPAAFWITNPNNTFTDNIAVEAVHGFWFAMPRQPLGMGPGLADFELIYPRRMPVKLFRNNKAHSCRFSGLHMDDMQTNDNGNTEMANWEPRDWSALSITEQRQLAQQQESDWENALEYNIARGTHKSETVIESFTAYRCGEFGIWGRGEGIRITNAVLADNQRGAQFPGQGNMFETSVIIGETDNLGNPLDKNRDQGRSRFYRWSEAHPIIGYRHYDAGSPDLIRNVKFVNFRPVQFLFTGKIRRAAAISVQGGNHVIPPRNRYYNMKFVNVDTRLYFEDDGSIAHRGAVVVDGDGSITGKCGAEMVTRYDVMWDSNCREFADWNAYVCPPGNKPHRYINIIDRSNGNSGICFPRTDADRVQNQLTMWRVYDKKSFAFPPYLDYSNNRFCRTINAMTNTEYFLQFGANSVTPDLIEIEMYSGSKEEWVRFAVPYPQGTTFTFEDSHVPASMFAPSSSLDTLNMTTYYYDSTLKVLWVELRFKNLQYMQYYGKEFLTQRTYIRIRATCPDGSCAQAVNPNSVVSRVRGVAPVDSELCESGGNFVGGEIVYSQPSGTIGNVFTDDVDPEWRIASWNNWTIEDRIAADGSQKSILAYLGGRNWKSIHFYRQNPMKEMPASDYTHLEFKVRTISGRGEIKSGSPLMLQFGDSAGQRLSSVHYPDVDTSSPYYTSTAPVDDTQWHVIRVPLEDVGVAQYGQIYRFTLVGTDYPRETPVYLDSIRFVRLTSTVRAREAIVRYAEVTNTPIKYRSTVTDVVTAGGQIYAPETSDEGAPEPPLAPSVVEPPPPTSQHQTPSNTQSDGNKDGAVAPAAGEFPLAAIIIMAALGAVVLICAIVIIVLIIKLKKGSETF